ncbi:MAG: tRNA 2-thiouridine(34) synthase MnmA [Candidatus Colwellbacteria bacterium CG10_big_fil_rev_8_21_14_0_10_41_28]|uniref:tRNA-specific 2-thiouridylase MnmA n=1 Tax=Candidatus Colwellbacteria bacterium CG10_big_fil_rev_8_21_14_0_10_41_28 TaxID=1974539 RepID=A0A2H0VJD8_9BACT|nr:MAG: tRNA 2-thiouridine(34) synthase MnmA [Candidatus Colwellbacteria bacterium CG10_big_fil_rev_8_21_14_0_10_41_28]
MDKMDKEKGRVFVGMSGGVDSSVAAYLLKKRGYEVIGVHLRCWNKNGCDEKEATDARLVAEHLNIPFYVFDMEKEYKERVVDYMIDGYRDGITPNPDVMCNKEIKFGLFMEKALSMGARFIATGHYARVKEMGGIYSIYRGKDGNKDQSYFLWTLNQDQLSKILFPLGDLKKDKVRKIAKKAGLHIADKKDSQGICFVGQVSIDEFLGEYLSQKEGQIINIRGEVVGTHRGAHFYTIGQRHGLGVALSEPYYVSKIDVNKNTVILAPEDDPSLFEREIKISKVNMVPNQETPQKVLVQIRYRQEPVSAILSQKNGSFHIDFDKPVKFVAPGQSAVFYNPKGQLIGGGIINS